MKTIITFPVLLLALASLFLLPGARADTVEEIVKQIRADYNATESARLTKRTIKTDDGPEVAELTKYYRGDDLVKMVYSAGSDHSSTTDCFYLKHGQIYFIYQSGGYWRFDPNGPEGTTIDTGRERRVYFHGNKVIRHLVKEVSSKDAEAIPRLLAKAKNRPGDGLEDAVDLGKAGYELLRVIDAAGLENFLHGE